jgi:hypothetical protein
MPSVCKSPLPSQRRGIKKRGRGKKKEAGVARAGKKKKKGKRDAPRVAINFSV